MRRITPQRWVPIALLAFLLQCGDRNRTVRYESASAKNGDVAAVVISRDGREAYGATKPAVVASLRANRSGAQGLPGGVGDDSLVGEWFCSDRSDRDLGRFTQDGGKTYLLP